MDPISAILLALVILLTILLVLHFGIPGPFYRLVDALEVRAWRILHRHQCSGPQIQLRREIVARNTAFQCADFRIEAQLIDIRIQCLRCQQIRQLHMKSSIQIPIPHEDHE